MKTAPIVAALIGVCVVGVANDRPSDFGAWFLRTYGAADAGVVAEAEKVFDRLLAVADRKSSRPPRLLVVNKAGLPEAQALPDGSIVINPELVRFCLGRSRPPGGDGEARLAFVLGHEMAHLAYDDAWHAEAFAALRRYGDQALADVTRDWVSESPAARQAKELRADRAGFLFMLMAGYPPQAVIGPRTDFLTEWARHSTPRDDAPGLRHPRFHQRSSVLRAQLAAVEAVLPFHLFGVRLLELGRFEDAIRLLERFRREVPSREVNANLGFAYSERAVARLAECGSAEAFRYRLLTSVDPETVAARLRLRGGSSSPKCESAARQDLDLAERLLREAHAQDRDYLAARLNLAAVLVMRGDGLDAYRVATGATELQSPPSFAKLEARLANVAAVALHLAGHALPLDTTDSALAILAELDGRGDAKDTTFRAAVAFNRARVLQERGRAAAARGAWASFLGLEGRGPYADEARAALGIENSPAGQSPPGPVTRDRLPLRLSAPVRKKLERADRRPFILGDLRGAFLGGDDLWALELGGVLELVDERLALPLDVRSLPSGQARVAFDSGDGRRTLVFQDTAYDVERGRVVRRLLFEPR